MGWATRRLSCWDDLICWASRNNERDVTGYDVFISIEFCQLLTGWFIKRLTYDFRWRYDGGLH